MNKIKNVVFKNFRVFKDQEFEIDESKNIILLYGNNGFGKTSFFDGIEWGFTGNLNRYKNPSKERNEYIVLKNYFAKPAEESYDGLPHL
jgi:exonuclease SbcC